MFDLANSKVSLGDFRRWMLSKDSITYNRPETDKDIVRKSKPDLRDKLSGTPPNTQRPPRVLQL